MALNFGQNLFQGASYLEGEDGNRAVVDIDGNLNVSGAVSFPAAQAVFFEKAEKVWFSGAQYVAFESAQDVTINGQTVNIAGQEVYAVQSGAYLISGDVDVVQSGAWTVGEITGDVNVVQSGAWTVQGDVNIGNVSGDINAVQSGAYIITGPVTQSGAWTVTGTTNVDIQNSIIDMNISGATIENNTLLSDWKWLIDNGTRVLASNSAANSHVVIYTVPSGKVFYLICGNLAYYTDADVAGSAQLTIDTPGLLTLKTNGDNSVGSILTAPTIPIKIASGAAVKVYSSDAAIKAGATVFGYVLDA